MPYGGADDNTVYGIVYLFPAYIVLYNKHIYPSKGFHLSCELMQVGFLVVHC